jgi:hypothetical protein
MNWEKEKGRIIFSLALIILSSSLIQAAEDDFTIILYPDTQYETCCFKPMWQSMSPWVLANKDYLNIKAVIGLGDVSDQGLQKDYKEAQTGFDMLKNAGIVVVPMRGNHDPLRAWSRQFSPSYFAGQSWYGNSSVPGDTTAYYVTFTSGDQKYIVIALGDLPSASNIAWAQKIIDENPDSKVIIDTHTYLGSYSMLSAGKTLWENFIKKNKNVFLVVCGHVNSHCWDDATLNIQDVGINGNLVNQYRADYQFVNRGNGFLVIMKIQPSQRNMLVSVFSPYSGQFDQNATKTLMYM